MSEASAKVGEELEMRLIDEPDGVVRIEIDRGEIQSLAENIREIGLLQPIVVRPRGERFEVVAGHRRYLAHKLLQREKIACVIRSIDDLQCAVCRASENLRRVDLSPIEEAAIYLDLREKHGMTPDQIGAQMGKSAGVVKRRLDLLKMPPQLQQAVHLGQISYGVAEELWRISDLGMIDYYLGYAIEHGITVSVARDWVKQYRRSQSEPRGDVGRGGGEENPLAERPVYVTCEVCFNPEEVSKASYIGVCAHCKGVILKAMREKKAS